MKRLVIAAYSFNATMTAHHLLFNMIGLLKMVIIHGSAPVEMKMLAGNMRFSLF